MFNEKKYISVKLTTKISQALGNIIINTFIQRLRVQMVIEKGEKSLKKLDSGE